MTGRMRASLMILSLAVPPLAYAQAPELVRDIVVSGAAGSSPSSLTSRDGFVYFWASDGHGLELWKSDGTSQGTHLLKDISWDRWGSALFSAQPPFVSGDLIYFAIKQNPYGPIDLWRTDGTETGTFPVTADLGEADRHNWPPAFPLEAAPFGDHGAIFFGRNGGVYATDGTTAGTKMVAAFPVNHPRHHAARVGAYAYFTNDRTLFRTDGTQAGTSEVTTIDGGYPIEDVIAVGEYVYFTAFKGLDPVFQIFRIDTRTMATSLVQAFAAKLFAPPRLVPVGSSLVAVVWTGTQTEIWRIDENAVSTNVVRSELDLTEPVVATANHVFFWTRGESRQLWSSDGTGAGTRPIPFAGKLNVVGTTAERIWLTSDDGLHPVRSDESGTWTHAPGSGATAKLTRFPARLGVAAIGERALLTIVDPQHGAEPWVTDGTAAGTSLLKNIAHDGNSWGSGAQRFGETILFSAYQPSTGREPWITDGTSGGTRMLADVAFPTRESTPTGFTDLGNGRAIFRASDEELTHGVFSTDGTTAGTKLLKPRVETSLLMANGRALLFADRDLFISDGTAEGTTFIAEVGFLRGVQPAATATVAFFATHDALWRSDGTAAGTFAVGPTALDIEAVHDKIFFLADGRSRYELWVSDGSKAGTRLVKTFPDGLFIGPWLQSANGIVIFSGVDRVSGREPWRSDGTAAGTFLLRDIAPGSHSSLLPETDPDMTASVGGVAYFIARDDVHGTELWRTDGTREGTRLVQDLGAGPASSNPSHLRAIGSRLFFSADDRRHGRELWWTRGIRANLVADLAPGATSSFPREMTLLGPYIYFFATTEESGDELWRVRIPVPGRDREDR